MVVERAERIQNGLHEEESVDQYKFIILILNENKYYQ